MKKLLLIAFVLISFFANSQSNYQRKLFSTAPTGTVSDVIYTNEYNTTTLLMENITGPTPYSGFATLTKFTTTTGNVTSSKSFSITGYDLAIKHVVKNNQMLYMIAALTNSASTTGCIIKYNLSTNATVWRRTLAINQTPYVLKAITYDSDKYLYALGCDDSLNASLSNLFVTKLDTLGNLVWVKTIGESSLAQKPSTILYNGKRELYVTSVANLSGASKATTLRLDSSANVLNSNTIYTVSPSGFQEKYSAILKGKLVTIDKTMTLPSGDVGAFLIRVLDTNLVAVKTKTLDGLNIKQIFANTNNLLITGAATNSLTGFKTVRLDTLLNYVGGRSFNKISTGSNWTSAVCFINSTNNSYHFFKPNGNDTVVFVRADNFEIVGCRDSVFMPITPNLTYSTMPYTYTTTPISGTLTTITLPVGTVTYSSTSLCTALTTGINSVTKSNLISIYPNPAIEMINFKLEMVNEGSTVFVKILNNIGQLISFEEIRLENNSGVLSTNELGSGIYFLSIYDENKQVLGVKKFVKE